MIHGNQEYDLKMTLEKEEEEEDEEKKIIESLNLSKINPPLLVLFI